MNGSTRLSGNLKKSRRSLRKAQQTLQEPLEGYDRFLKEVSKEMKDAFYDKLAGILLKK
jgi:uncharacterized protein YlxW (UPF0749 family)